MGEFDNTYLSVDKAEERGLIHRDYIAHCLRWNHVAKYLRQQNRYKWASILDVGCGREVPLLKTLYVNKMTPHTYVGVNMGSIYYDETLSKIQAKMDDRMMLYQKENFIDWKPPEEEMEEFHVITCFEVLEHMHPKYVMPTLDKIHYHLHEEGVAFISTPVWDPTVGAAENHINEMRYDVMSYLLRRAGFNIIDHWGTFASQKDIEIEIAGHGYWEPYEKMKEYYDSNLVACLFAPLFPGNSRNVIWKVEMSETVFKDPPPLMDNPWSSSNDWRALYREVDS